MACTKCGKLSVSVDPCGCFPAEARQTDGRTSLPMHKVATKNFKGHYVIYRKLPRGLSQKAGGTWLPRFMHQSFEGAEQEAHRLSGRFPESTFVIMRVVATVKPRPASGIEGEAGDAEERLHPEGESPVGEAETPNPSGETPNAS